MPIRRQLPGFLLLFVAVLIIACGDSPRNQSPQKSHEKKRVKPTWGKMVNDSLYEQRAWKISLPVPNGWTNQLPHQAKSATNPASARRPFLLCDFRNDFKRKGWDFSGNFHPNLRVTVIPNKTALLPEPFQQGFWKLFGDIETEAPTISQFEVIKENGLDVMVLEEELINGSGFYHNTFLRHKVVVRDGLLIGISMLDQLDFPDPAVRAAFEAAHFEK